MSVVARFTVPADQFPLGDLLEVRRGIRVRLETVIPTGESVVPYVWVSTQDTAAIEAALERSPLVDAFHLVEQTDEETLLRVEWSTAVNGLFEALRETEAAILQGKGFGDNWVFQIRFSEHDDVSTFYQSCLENDVSLTLDELNYQSVVSEDPTLGITERQREALLAALDSGYFAVPRRVTLTDLADQFDISDTAFSQRLRRGLTAVLSSTLQHRPTADAPDDED